MKKAFLLLFVIGFAFTQTSQAQRLGYVDMDFILEKIPEYKKAQEQLDALAETWQKEMEAKYAAIESAYSNFQNQQYLYDEKMKKEKIAEIEAMEKEVNEYQQSKFGYNGELAKKRIELVKPIQDRVYDAIQEYANENSYDFIFDKGSTGVLFASSRRDKTEEILKKLGY